MAVVYSHHKTIRIYFNQKQLVMNNIDQLRELLEQASAICEDNLYKTENVDLHSMMETLDEFIDELNAAENFEIYNDEIDDYE
jgi:hypothetical protein